jgi:hypothetical protein
MSSTIILNRAAGALLKPSFPSSFFLTFFGTNFMRQGWRLRRIMRGKKNFLLHLFYYITDLPSLWQMAYNVLAVTDVFLRPIRKNAKHFYGRKKMWRRKTAQRAKARLRFFVAQAAQRAAMQLQSC